MRARYYSPDLHRFVNADLVPGRISNAVTLNRYAYANATPAMYVDPTGLLAGALVVGGVLLFGLLLGLSASSKQEEPSNNQSVPQNDPQETPQNPSVSTQYTEEQNNLQENETSPEKKQKTDYEIVEKVTGFTGYAADVFSPFGKKAAEKAIRNDPRPNNIGKGIWEKHVNAEIANVNKAFDYIGYGTTTLFTILNTGMGIDENIKNGETTSEIISDAAIDIGSGAVSITVSVLLTKAGTIIAPGWGTLIGLGVGLAYDFILAPRLDKAFE